MIRRSVAILAASLAGSAGAQAPARPAVVEGRVDGFFGRHVGAQAAGGLTFDAGTYLRVAVIAGVGAERREDDVVVGTQRAEVVARFHVDPFRQAHRGLYFGGGVGARHSAGGRVRPTLVALVGLEGRPRGGVAPAIELGVGGGARVGLALRRARSDRR